MPSVDLDAPEHDICSRALAIGREREKGLVAECAALRVQVSRLQAELLEERHPEEKRQDGSVVRKARWENGIRNIAAIVGMGNASFEVPDIVEAVRKLAASLAPSDPSVKR